MDFKQWFEQDYSYDFESDPSHIFGRELRDPNEPPRPANTPPINAGNTVVSGMSFSKLLKELEAVKARLNSVEKRLQAQQADPNKTAAFSGDKTIKYTGN